MTTRLQRMEAAQARLVRHPLIRSINLRLAALARPLLERSTRDGSEELLAGSAMVIAPHPDDESIGCGGLIAAKTDRSSPVWIVVVSNGARSHTSEILDPNELAQIRAGELRDAAAALGVPPDRVHMLGFDDRSIADRADELSAALAELIRDAAPSQLIVPSDRDANADHRAVFEAAVRAVASLAPPTDIAPPEPAAPEASGTEVAVPGVAVPGVAVPGVAVPVTAVPVTAVSIPEVLTYLVWFWTPEAWVDQGSPTVRKLGQLVARLWSFLVDADRLAFDPGPYAATKDAAIRCHRSQLENLTGEPGWAVIEPKVLDLLVGRREIYVRHNVVAAGRGFEPISTGMSTDLTAATSSYGAA